MLNYDIILINKDNTKANDKTYGVNINEKDKTT